MRINLAAINSTKGRIIIGLALFLLLDIAGVVCITKVIKDQVQGTVRTMPDFVTKEVITAAFDPQKSEHLANGEWHFVEAQRYELAKNYAKAHEAYVKAVDEFTEALGGDAPATCLLMTAQGIFEYNYGKDTVAEVVLRRAVSGLDKGKIDNVALLGAKDCLADVLQRQRKYPEAIQLYTDCVNIAKRLDQEEQSKSQTNCLKAMDTLQWCYCRAEKFDKAQQVCEEALAIARQSHSQINCLKAMDSLKQCYFCEKKYDKAEQIGEEALTIARSKPDNNKELIRMLLELGAADCNTGQYSKAVEHCTEAIKIDPQRYRPYCHRAYAYSRMKNYGHAIEDFTAAINREEGDASLYFERADTFERIGRYQDAIADYSKFIPPENRIPHKTPEGSVGAPIDCHQFLILRGNDYQKLHQSQQAISDYSQAIKSMTQCPQEELAAVYEKRASSYIALGKPDLAAADRVSAQHARGAKPSKKATMPKWEYMEHP